MFLEVRSAVRGTPQKRGPRYPAKARSAVSGSHHLRGPRSVGPRRAEGKPSFGIQGSSEENGCTKTDWMPKCMEGERDLNQFSRKLKVRAKSTGIA